MPAREKQVFGKEVEYILKHLLYASPYYEVLLHSLQLIEHKNTLGELDFILRDLRRGELIHLEVAYKFYLCIPVGEKYQLIGPNRRDSLSAKLKKLKERQFKLLHHPLTRSILASRGFSPKNCRQELFMPGQLYLPLTGSAPSSTVLNPGSIMGHYIPYSQFANYFSPQQMFYIPAKKEWPFEAAENFPWQNFDSCNQSLKSWQKRAKSPMIWVRYAPNQYRRFFITNWQ